MIKLLVSKRFPAILIIEALRFHSSSSELTLQPKLCIRFQFRSVSFRPSERLSFSINREHSAKSPSQTIFTCSPTILHFFVLLDLPAKKTKPQSHQWMLPIHLGCFWSEQVCSGQFCTTVQSYVKRSVQSRRRFLIVFQHLNFSLVLPAKAKRNICWIQAVLCSPFGQDSSFKLSFRGSSVSFADKWMT